MCARLKTNCAASLCRALDRRGSWLPLRGGDVFDDLTRSGFAGLGPDLHPDVYAVVGFQPCYPVAVW